MSDHAHKIVTARKPHRCDARADYPYPCLRVIEPGTKYIRAVSFPGDVNASSVPWVMRICDNCAASYGDTRDLVEATAVRAVPVPIRGTADTGESA